MHTDPLAAGRIDAPYLDGNEHRPAWIGRTDWHHRTTFTWSPDAHERTDLVCDDFYDLAGQPLLRRPRPAAERPRPGHHPTQPGAGGRVRDRAVPRADAVPLTLQDGELALVNDTAEPWTGDLRLTRHAMTGEPLAKEVVAVHTAPRSVLKVALPPSMAVPDDPARELLAARLGGARMVRCHAEDTAVAFPEAGYDAHVERSAA